MPKKRPSRSTLRRSGLLSLSTSSSKAHYKFNKSSRFGYDKIPSYYRKKSLKKPTNKFSYDPNSIYN